MNYEPIDNTSLSIKQLAYSVLLVISSIGCVIASIHARLMNFGWMTIGIAIYVLPYFLIHFSFMSFYIRYFDKMKLKSLGFILLLISNIGFVAFSIFMPDRADDGKWVAYYGSVKVDLGHLYFQYSEIAFLTSIGCTAFAILLNSTVVFPYILRAYFKPQV